VRRSRLPTLAVLTLAVVSVVGCARRQGPRSAWPTAPSSPASPSVRASQGTAQPDGSTGPPSEPFRADRVYEVGIASWYGNALRGRKTSSGERFDPGLYTAAHKRLPFGTWVEVRRSDTGQRVCVRINDRGPNGHAAHRIIDLSERAAAELDMIRQGVVEVELRIISGPSACGARWG
jgi:rare lipoprotein A